MEQIESQSKNEELEKKIEKLQQSIDRLNKIFFWTLIITVVLFALPLLGLLFAIPQFLAGLGGL
jgi:cell division protein FtsL